MNSLGRRRRWLIANESRAELLHIERLELAALRLARCMQRRLPGNSVCRDGPGARLRNIHNTLSILKVICSARHVHRTRYQQISGVPPRPAEVGRNVASEEGVELSC